MICIRPSLSRIICRSSALVSPWTQVRFATIVHGRNVGRQKGSKDHWTAERLQTNEKYPLTSALNEAIHPSLEPKKAARKRSLTSASSTWSGVHVRTQIVSPDLCDDVIKYIGHTLEQYKGCDILDINPGAGLWSQKIHEFLQPRSHVLLEPRYEKFETFLAPLLDAPDSKYSLVVKDPCDLDTYRTMVNEGAFPHQTPRDPQHPRAQEPNNTLLVIGSLVWDPRLPGLGFDSMAKQLFYHFAAAAPSNDLFHAYGLVRTLFWVQHDDFSPMIAESVAGMQKANRFLEMTHKMNVIVNAERTHRKIGRGSTGREPQYEIESTIHALKRGRETGMTLPQHRRQNIHDFAEEIEKASNGTGISRSFYIQNFLHDQQMAGNSTVGLLPESFIEHCEQGKLLLREYPDIHFERWIMALGKSTAPRPSLSGHPAKEPVISFFKRRSMLLNIAKVKGEVEALADIGEEMYLLECKIIDMEDGPEKDASMQRLKNLDDSWQHGVDHIAPNYSSAPLAEIDDRLAIRTPPYPRLQWDHRPFEPLIMSPSEVWPQNRLSLISSEPIPNAPSQDPDWLEWAQDFVFGLYSQPAMAINLSLDKMQHGLSDIIKDCPSLKDPKRGGRLQMHHLRVRMLTMEMIEELVAAYREWPFKAPGSDHNKYFRHKGAAQGYVGRVS
ncbi:hypothetical protein BKA66DRAFT_565054 [Pyrenochaeta sp. MPI-SDFR-AT-0127]|nr:hypothetical protein BKA66DRAFT_565054 [Pyrenochaeta sp. MPI-SDFR-AT-0127]